MELLLRRSAEVHPHDGVGLLEVLGDVGDGEALGLEHTLAVHPGHGIAHDILHAHRDEPQSFDAIPWIRVLPGCSGRGLSAPLDREMGGRADPISEFGQSDRTPGSPEHHLKHPILVLHRESDGVTGNPRAQVPPDRAGSNPVPSDTARTQRP